MNKTDLLNKLRIHRSSLADSIEQPALRGVKVSVTDKYSDQAHFIYELLQNADDVKATKVEMQLHPEGLYFKHNGKVRFSITDPDNEEIDTKNNCIGHINSITSIGNSNKINSQIGKFGVGFKAVFQYTEDPIIYDEDISFRIHRFIVPEIFEDKSSLTTKGHTVFLLKFNKKGSKPIESYSDVLNKLKTLEFPTLFLSNLKEIEWLVYNNDNILIDEGLYSESVLNKEILDNTEYRNIEYNETTSNISKQIKLISFSRTHQTTQFKYSIVYLKDSNDNLISDKIYPAFCFFSTKEVTNLKFLINAPFLLTDSRATIKSGNKHNEEMIELLSLLAADSLIYLKGIGARNNQKLIDDNLLNLIPIDPNVFTEVGDRNSVSFKPFYTNILKKLQTHCLLPTKEGKYTNKERAFWSEVLELTELFSSEQLSEIMNVKDAHWVFSTITKRSGTELISKYIDGQFLFETSSQLVNDVLSTDKLFRKINKDFISSQPTEWLIRFYHYLLDNQRYLWDKSSTKNFLRTRPIIKLENGTAISPYSSIKDDKVQVYLPSGSNEEDSKVNTIDKELCKDDKCVEFFMALGIRKPDLFAVIQDHILNIYKSNKGEEISDADILSHFKIIIDYYKSADSFQRQNLFKELNGISFLVGKKFCDNEEPFLITPNEAYIRTDDLDNYFLIYNRETEEEIVEVNIRRSVKPHYYLDFSFYTSIIKDDTMLFDSFINDLRITSMLKTIDVDISKTEYQKRLYGIPTNIQSPSKTYAEKITDKELDGVNIIITKIDLNTSVLLLRTLREEYSKHQLNSFRCIYEYVPKSLSKVHILTYDSSIIKLLKNKPWLFDKDMNLKPITGLTLNDLNPDYKINEIDSKLLYELGLSQVNSVINDLNSEDLELYQIGKMIKDHNITKDELLQFIENKRHPQLKENDLNSDVSTIDKGKETVIKAIQNKIDKKRTNNSENLFVGKDEPNEIDKDDFTKPAIDIKSETEKLEDKLASEIADLTKLAELQDIVNNSEEYSFQWFNALLEIEYFQNFEKDSKGKEINISFSSASVDEQSKTMLILKNPSRAIPSYIEDIPDLSINLYFEGKEKKNVSAEVVNIQDFTLRAKIKGTINIDELPLDKLQRATIDVKNPIFILECLKNEFKKLQLENTFNLRTNLTKNIEFVFGPPGTGKTTYIAKDIVLNKVKDENLKILILTPTNKAADVLTKKIMNSCEEEGEDYSVWLTRFGITADKDIEDSGIWREKQLNIEGQAKAVIVTTMARFPYDFIVPDYGFEGVYLKDIEWDLIIFDEASMINLASILYVLYKQKEGNFIIGGDPFQIPPTSFIKELKDKNIYSLVNLSSFANPKTTPHDYKIVNLGVQYRSTPIIGNIYSNFMYDGLLNHNRNISDKKGILNLDFEISDINIVKFPVNGFTSIFKPQRLVNTPYHIYSAILCYEFTKYVIGKIAGLNDKLSVGVICPYRAQASLIDKLISSKPFDYDKSKINVGTIHGFQGDESDIIICVFNPPPSLSNNPNIFLNKQNILNVSISRARDYLFILMPDDDTRGIGDLKHINNIQSIIKEQAPNNYKEYHSFDIEEFIFKNRNYIKDNAFSTTHQEVNVYSQPISKYEIRCEEYAIDVQLL
ncbi:MAG: DEAD/DEAH box helicase [Ignavibacteria bacterium]